MQTGSQALFHPGKRPSIQQPSRGKIPPRTSIQIVLVIQSKDKTFFCYNYRFFSCRGQQWYAIYPKKVHLQILSIRFFLLGLQHNIIDDLFSECQLTCVCVCKFGQTSYDVHYHVIPLKRLQKMSTFDDDDAYQIFAQGNKMSLPVLFLQGYHNCIFFNSELLRKIVERALVI